MAAYLCSALVGLVFLVTGALKALDSGSFLTQVRRYRLLSRRFERPAALFFIGFECALGASLIAGASELVFAIAGAVLAAFAGLTLWATASGRVEDCGCYGGLMLLTPAQSVALDGLYLVLLAAGWLIGVPALPALWAALVAAVFLVAGIAHASRSSRKPLADLALLRPGRNWRRGWLKGYARDLTRGSHFVVFLSRDCPYCKRWVPMLNVIEVQPELPAVVGIMSLQGEQLQGFLAEHMIRFPIVHMPQSLVSMMVGGYPTAALVEDGKIRQKWYGEMPQEYVDRIRQFFEAVAPPKQNRARAFGG